MRKHGHLKSAFKALAKALTGLDWMVIGGLAVIHRGFPRLTTDVDAVVTAEGLDLESLLERLASNGLASRVEDPVGFARKAHILLLVHAPSLTDIDLALSWLPFEREAIIRASPETILGTRAKVASPEDLLIYKAFAGRPKDWEDAERMLVMYSGQIRLEYVRRVLLDLFQVMEEPHRMNDFEALLHRCSLG